jgi:hypothetical protein
MSKKREIRNDNIRSEIRKRNELGMKIKDAIQIVSDMYYLSSERVRDIWYFKDKTYKKTKQIQSILCIGLVCLITSNVV